MSLVTGAMEGHILIIPVNCVRRRKALRLEPGEICDPQFESLPGTQPPQILDSGPIVGRLSQTVWRFGSRSG